VYILPTTTTYTIHIVCKPLFISYTGTLVIAVCILCVWLGVCFVYAMRLCVAVWLCNGYV